MCILLSCCKTFAGSRLCGTMDRWIASKPRITQIRVARETQERHPMPPGSLGGHRAGLQDLQMQAQSQMSELEMAPGTAGRAWPGWSLAVPQACLCHFC